MKSKMVERVIFMVIGAVLAIVGFMFGKMNTNASDTSQAKVFDRLKVRNLVVSGKISLVKEGSTEPVELVIIEHNRNGAIMQFLHEKQKSMLIMGIHDETSVLSLEDFNEGNIVALKADSEITQLSISNVSGATATIQTRKDGNGGLSLYSGMHNAVVGASIVAGMPMLDVSQKDGKGGAVLTVIDGNGVITTRNAFGVLQRK